MHRALAICVLLATATGEAHGDLLRRWLARGQLPAPWQPTVAAAADRDEALSFSTINAEWSKLANDTGNSVMYFVETKRELFVFDKAVPATLLTPGKTRDKGVPSASTRAPATSTGVPAASTRVPTTSARVPTTSTRVPATSTRVTATSTRVPATSTSAPTASSSASPTSTTTPLPSLSTFPPGYSYYLATNSYYKFHYNKERSWYDANATCAAEGAYLTVLDDAEEADIIKRIIKNTVGTNYGIWLGLHDSRPAGVSDWRTVHGVPLSEVFHDWYAGRPYNDGGDTCGLFSASPGMQLFDRPCSDFLEWNFICERPQ